MLIMVYSSALHRRTRLVLAGVTDPVMDILAATRTDRLLTVCRTPAELERALRGEG
jgi:hypothetical protein